MDFYYNQLELSEKSTNLSEYHAKTYKNIVVTGYKRVYLRNEASWRLELCVRILAKYSSLMHKDGFLFHPTGTRFDESIRISCKNIQKHRTGYKRVYLSNEASWRCENCIRILAKYSSFLIRTYHLSEYHAKTYKIHRSDRI